MRAILALEDGWVAEGECLGAPGATFGEMVFNTGMTGYQEILTDPSYAGQIVCLTYPLVGNYGINSGDSESRSVQVAGFVVREAEEIPSNWRSSQTLRAFLRERGVVAIQGVDTRALTRRLRSHGVMMGAISTEHSVEDLLRKLASAPRYGADDLIRQVTTPQPYVWPAGAESLPEAAVDQREGRLRVALLDCGVKFNILRSLASLGCSTTVFPCTADADEILASRPNGVVLSPGPGDPAVLGYVVETVRRLVDRTPILGVCLGNQILGAVFGARTFKLKFGHRGSNHPVKDLASGRVAITSQNHGYAVDPDGLRDGMEVSQLNLNDGTVEGLTHRELPVFSIQYHPEASPGPNDSAHYFRRFVALLRPGEPSERVDERARC